MSLLQRLKTDPRGGNGKQGPATAAETAVRDAAMLHPNLQTQHAYYELKERIHRRLIDKLDLAVLDTIPAEVLRVQVREVVENLLQTEESLAWDINRDRLSEEILNETFGLGPLEPLLHDPTVSDILVNTFNQVYVERFGKLESTNTQFRDDAHLMHIIERIVSKIGRRVENRAPWWMRACPMAARQRHHSRRWRWTAPSSLSVNSTATFVHGRPAAVAEPDAHAEMPLPRPKSAEHPDPGGTGPGKPPC